MTPVIRISDATWKRLQLHAVPLEDDAEDVIVKLLDTAERAESHAASVAPQRSNVSPLPTRLSRGQRTTEEVYKPHILKALARLGGRADANDILKIVETEMQDILKPADRIPLKSGTDLRWRNSAQWARKTLKDEGLLKSDSPRGIWELSEHGWEAARSLKA